MQEVSKAKFFSTIGQMNVHPRPERDVTFWETPNRQLIGKSTPGYLCSGPKQWFLNDRADVLADYREECKADAQSGRAED